MYIVHVYVYLRPNDLASGRYHQPTLGIQESQFTDYSCFANRFDLLYTLVRTWVF